MIRNILLGILFFSFAFAQDGVISYEVGKSKTPTLQQALSLNGFYLAQQKRMADALDFPMELAKQRIQGEATLNLVFNNKGELLFIKSIQSQEPYLAAWTTISVLSTLRAPLRKSLWEKSGQIEMTLIADYRVNTYEAEPKPEYIPVVGSQMRVVKVATVNPKLTDLYRRYWPPILPLPSGLYVDVVRIYEIVKNWNAPSEEELERLQKIKFEDYVKSKLEEVQSK